MPSSRELVATIAFSSPFFSRLSTTRRSSRERDPWWDQASGSGWPSLMNRASFSAWRREFTKKSVERFAAMMRRHSRARASKTGSSPGRAPARGAARRQRRELHAQLVRLAMGQCTISPGVCGSSRSRRRPACPRPPRLRQARDTRPRGPQSRTAASRLRRARSAGTRRHRRTRRSTAVTRCVPRFEPATAWISSRMTAATPSSIRRLFGEERMRFRLSGVVMRISGGLRSIRRRSPRRGVPAPGQHADARGRVSPPRGRRSPALQGAPGGFSGYRCSAPSAGRRTGCAPCPVNSAPVASWLMPQRKAARVLPVPVGADTSACAPCAIIGQAFAWTSVGRSHGGEKPAADERMKQRERILGSTGRAHSRGSGSALHRARRQSTPSGRAVKACVRASVPCPRDALVDGRMRVEVLQELALLRPRVPDALQGVRERQRRDPGTRQEPDGKLVGTVLRLPAVPHVHQRLRRRRRGSRLRDRPRPR